MKTSDVHVSLVFISYNIFSLHLVYLVYHTEFYKENLMSVCAGSAQPCFKGS